MPETLWQQILRCLEEFDQAAAAALQQAKLSGDWDAYAQQIDAAEAARDQCIQHVTG